MVNAEIGLASLLVRPLAAPDGPALLELFLTADCPCYCQYWQFRGDHREWQDRCANGRDDSRRELLADVALGRVTGAVAQSGTEIVGWLRISVPLEMSKLYEGRLYRALPCFASKRERVVVVGCCLVAPDWRRRGVGKALLAAAIESCRARGDRALEAFPRGATDVSDAEQWMGPQSMFEAAGFQTVHDFGPYPVLRLELASSAVENY